MSKLDGNKRWESKMTLPEHVEQYEARGDVAIKASRQPDLEELTMIRDYILLPHMLTMVERNIEDMQHTSALLKRLYLQAARAVLGMISKDLYDLRRELAKRNIKVYADEQVDLIIYHRYICRGYEDRFGIVREVMRAEISERLARYVGEIGMRIKNGAPD